MFSWVKKPSGLFKLYTWTIQIAQTTLLFISNTCGVLVEFVEGLLRKCPPLSHATHHLCKYVGIGTCSLVMSWGNIILLSWLNTRFLWDSARRKPCSVVNFAWLPVVLRTILVGVSNLRSVLCDIVRFSDVV